ncbi:MAG TPA: DUF126 domain-containing protein [Vicinamibacteria bacterium]|nr:DUF126 domain-containing protein [Vicinamibacteria bacterium]
MPEKSYHRSIAARALVPGSARGKALVSSEPLSLWGGLDPNTGEIVDRRHPLSGENAAGRVLVLPSTRGSSTTTAILLEAVRTGKAPAAIVSRGDDAFFALASIVADEMYGKPIPIFSVSAEDFASLRTGQLITLEESGTIRLEDAGEA